MIETNYDEIDVYKKYVSGEYKIRGVHFMNWFKSIKKKYNVQAVNDMKPMTASLFSALKTYYKTTYNADLIGSRFFLILKIKSNDEFDWTTVSTFPSETIDIYYLIRQDGLDIREERRFCPLCRIQLLQTNNKYCHNCYKFSKKVVVEEERM